MKSQGIDSFKIEQPNKLSNVMRTLANPVLLIAHDNIAFFRNKPDTNRFRFTTNRCIKTDTDYRTRFSEELVHSPVQYFRKFEAGLTDGGCLKHFTQLKSHRIPVHIICRRRSLFQQVILKTSNKNKK